MISLSGDGRRVGERRSKVSLPKPTGTSRGAKQELMDFFHVIGVIDVDYERTERLDPNASRRG